MQAIDPSAGFAPVPAVLIVRQGRSPGQQLPVTKTPVTLGRDAANDLAINDPQISRRHASLSWDGLHWILQDLGECQWHLCQWRAHQPPSGLAGWRHCRPGHRRDALLPGTE